MTTTVAPICIECVYFRRNGKGLTCKAFPKGIPDDILFSRHDHRQAFEGDRGIVFEQDPERPAPPFGKLFESD